MKKDTFDKKVAVSRSRPTTCSAHADEFHAERFKQVCQNCQGTGKTLDNHAVGCELRRLRLKAGVRLRGIAAQLGFSPAFISDLERGNRTWNEDKIKAYKKALGLT